jgi:ribonuclease BN (tRNA processing enzyme)
MSKNGLPSEKTIRKLNALRILTTKVYHPLDIAEILVNEGVMTERDMLEMRACQDKTEFLFVALEKANRDDKLQLLDYSWQILPTQSVCLTVLTATKLHEFRHEEP